MMGEKWNQCKISINDKFAYATVVAILNENDDHESCISMNVDVYTIDQNIKNLLK